MFYIAIKDSPQLQQTKNLLKDIEMNIKEIEILLLLNQQIL